MKWEEKYSQPVIFHCDRLRSPSPPYISPIPIPYYTSAIVDCCMSLTTPHHDVAAPLPQPLPPPAARSLPPPAAFTVVP